jgi:hypothetical protein
MKPKKAKSTVTNTSLDEIYKKLCKSGGESLYDQNGKPVYGLWFSGTEEEYEAMKRKLIELNPNDPPTP